ncbi:hypothetical protein WCX49_07880 [Sulfurimonas sp. HSL-1656]|uniref:hypothetical protein n=1 Tax=Thiomicrolovo subterrani TaxID=3131934 RepID=UPI0031F9817D
MTEKELVENVLPFFKKHSIYCEVKIFTRSIDVVLKRPDNKLIAIEFKLKNYQKAFEQISDYQIVSDYSYLCIPKRNISHQILQTLTDRGIGLYMYDHEKHSLEEIIKPKKSHLHIPFYRDYLFQKLEEKERNL